MRLVHLFAATALLAEPAFAQPAPDQGPGPDQPPPYAQQAPGQQPDGQPPSEQPQGPAQGQGGQGHRGGPMFDAANVTHDGRLTRDQAQAGGMRHIVQHFDEIDADHKGYVTKQEIKAWQHARAAQRQPQQQQ